MYLIILPISLKKRGGGATGRRNKYSTINYIGIKLWDGKMVKGEKQTFQSEGQYNFCDQA